VLEGIKLDQACCVFHSTSLHSKVPIANLLLFSIYIAHNYARLQERNTLCNFPIPRAK
jgi:hypothetical protein